VLNELYAKYQEAGEDRAPSQSEGNDSALLAANGPFLCLTYISHFALVGMAEGDAASPSAPQQGAVRRSLPSIS